LEARRQELHAVALEALEDIYSDELHHHYGELAYHSEQAVIKEKARDYLRKAGDTARDLYRNLEAIDYYSRALAHILPDNLLEKFDVLLERAAIFDRRGDRSSQIKDLDDLEKLALKLENDKYKATVWNTKAEYFYSISDFASAIESAKHALGFPDDYIADEILLGAFVTIANSLLRLGRLDDAMKEAEDGLAIARRSRVRLEEGRILNTMGLIAIEQKETKIAKKCLVEAVNIARELGNLVLEGKSLNNLAHLAGTIQGDFSQAREYFELAFEIFHERGDRYGQGILVGNLGWCAGMQGDFRAARKYLEQSLAIAREVGNAYQEAYTLINLSSVTGIQGEASTAINYANQAYDMSLKIGERSGEACDLERHGLI
jgi:tetratricopeptide (TPR) repeat protein